MSDNTDVCDHGPVAVGVAPDHQTAGGVDVIVLAISAGRAEVGADRGYPFHVLEILKLKRLIDQLWLSFSAKGGLSIFPPQNVPFE